MRLYPKSKQRVLREKLIKGIGFVILVIVLLLLFTAGTSEEDANEPIILEDDSEKISYKDGVGKDKYGYFKIDSRGELVEEYEPLDDSNLTEEEIYALTVETYDLNLYSGNNRNPKSKGNIVLLLIPLRDAENVLPLMFRNLMNMTYPHELIDLAFLVSDCSANDHTLEAVFDYSVQLQNGTLLSYLEEEEKLKLKQTRQGSLDLYLKYMDKAYTDRIENAFKPPYHKDYEKPFRSVQIFKKDFGQVIGQGFSDRHDVKVQGIRRKLMGRARNWLLSSALKPYHSWVYWRDADIETSPGDVMETLMSHNQDFDVVVPNVWRPLPTFLGNEQPYDLNSWIESETGLELAKTLNEDDVIVEGYAEYPTWRLHLAYIRETNGDPNECIDLDGVGGVSILAKARIFRQGTMFPLFTFMNHAETELFGKLLKKIGFRVGGLPHYTIWHVYEPSDDDLKEIAKLERKKRRDKKQSN